MQGRWDRAALYVQDWYSWRAQPRLRFEDDGTVRAQWSSRGQYPPDADIDWLQPTAEGGYEVTYGSDDDRLLVTPRQVDVYLGGTAYPVTIADDAATAPAGAPGAIRQDGNKVVVDFGFDGPAEICTTPCFVKGRLPALAPFTINT